MENRQDINTEKILNSLDGCQPASAPDFFYTRLKARMEKEILPAPARSWVPRPVLILGMTLVLVMVNIVLVIRKDTASPKSEESITQQSLAAEYNITNESNTIYDLNQEK